MSVKFIGRCLTVPAASGFGLFAGCTLLSMTTGVPFLSFVWPLVTTCAPGSMPLRIATWSPRVGPVVTKTCCAISCAPPFSSFLSSFLAFSSFPWSAGHDLR